jgi:cytoskeletal protein RodZ
METIGKRLRTARESREMSIEDVAHETRIQAIYIRGLENDDYSNFASTTYAKSFLTLYSRFLDVDAGEALLQFAGSDSISLGGQGYLEAVPDRIQPQGAAASRSPYFSSREPAPKRATNANSPGLAPIFLGLLLLLLVLAIPTMWYLGKDAETFEEAVSNAEELAKNAKLTTTDPAAQTLNSAAASQKIGEETPQTGPPPPKVRPLPTPIVLESAEPNFPKVEENSAAVPPESVTETPPSNEPVRARPVVTLPETQPKTGEEAQPETGEAPEPATPPVTSPGPLRAIPLARPVVLPVEGANENENEEDAGSESEATNADEPAVETGEAGNRYPRPVE